MLRTLTRVVTLVLFCTPMAACDAAAVDDPDVLRGLGHESDADFAVYEGVSTTNPDCLIWDIAGDGVFNGPEEDDDLLWLLDETGTQIFDANGRLRCTIEEFDGPDFLVLREGSAGVVATQWHYASYEGDVSNDPRQHLINNPDYQVIGGVHVLDRNTMEKVATTTGNLAWASTKRKLLVSGLIMGVCGSDGLPPPPSAP